jgi:hypothetical protein
MMEAAREGLAHYSQRPLLIAVTVLTSMEAADLVDIGITASPQEHVLRLATLTRLWAGRRGVLRTGSSDAQVGTGGLQADHAGHPPGRQRRRRPAPGDDAGSCPAGGADYLVIGRPITRADAPLEVLRKINADIANTGPRCHENHVVGSGYVGLVTGTCLAEVGNHVLCLDVDPAKIATLQQGGIPIYEPGLEDMVRRNVAAGRLSFTTDIAAAVAFGEIQFIAVGTPPDEDGSADLQYVLAAARNIGLHMTEPKVVVDKSTVPVGTADKVKAQIAATLAERGADIAFSVVSNPNSSRKVRPSRTSCGRTASCWAWKTSVPSS